LEVKLQIAQIKSGNNTDDQKNIRRQFDFEIPALGNIRLYTPAGSPAAKASLLSLHRFVRDMAHHAKILTGIYPTGFHLEQGFCY
jgi:hypothetical protein